VVAVAVAVGIRFEKIRSFRLAPVSDVAGSPSDQAALYPHEKDVRMRTEIGRIVMAFLRMSGHLHGIVGITPTKIAEVLQ
jgi:hypothetical protein